MILSFSVIESFFFVVVRTHLHDCYVKSDFSEASDKWYILFILVFTNSKLDKCQDSHKNISLQ